MIGRLRGLVAETNADEAIIDVGGVGYVVRCGVRTLSRLPAVGEEALLHVETQWGEQTGMTLYGFLGRDERAAFLALKTIQGVGPKAALSVLDVLTPVELGQAAARQDKALVARAQGVGPKLALRIVMELKDKPLVSGSAAVSPIPVEPVTAPAPSAAGEAVAALMGLGVAEVNARRVIDQAVMRLGEDVEVGALIKAGLQELGR